MNDAEISARLIEALNAAAGAGARLVSVEITMLAPGDGARVAASVARRTKTLAFLTAECVSASGERIASATSVHRVMSA